MDKTFLERALSAAYDQAVSSARAASTYREESDLWLGLARRFSQVFARLARSRRLFASAESRGLFEEVQARARLFSPACDSRSSLVASP